MKLFNKKGVELNLDEVERSGDLVGSRFTLSQKGTFGLWETEVAAFSLPVFHGMEVSFSITDLTYKSSTGDL